MCTILVVYGNFVLICVLKNQIVHHGLIVGLID
jgi:hypothetical protein